MMALWRDGSARTQVAYLWFFRHAGPRLRHDLQLTRSEVRLVFWCVGHLLRVSLD